jgi:protein-S-isoprenylcysteine O-methyltransferase Ste14
MHIQGEIIAICWLVFIAVWFVAALYGRATMRSFSPSARAVRLLLVVAIVLGMFYGDRIRMPELARIGTALADAGDLLCIAGVAFAIWARVTLGRNWGMPMTLHDNPELVTAGPYRLVRHPIYTGLAAMFIGTALVFPLAAFAGVIMIAYMVFSARREERDMEARFPDAYPAYRQRSKMLVPFVI